MGFLRIFILNCLFFVFVGTTSVWAQVDASAQLLLSPSETPKPNATGLQSGRYKVKNEKHVEKKQELKRSPLPAKKVQQLDFRNPEIELATTVVLPPTTTLKPAEARKPEKPTALNQMLFSAPNPEIASQPTVTSVEGKIVEPVTVSGAAILADSKAVAEISPETPVTEQPAVTEQVKNIVMGNDLPAVEAYKEQIHPDDVRMNRMEISVLPGIIVNASKSSYSFRNYNSFSPKILLGAEFWLTPFMGIYGNYSTSMGADIVGDPTTNSRIPVQHEWTEIGIDLRRFFGMSRKSNSLQYGIHLSEYKFLVPGDDLHRVTLKSNGIGLHLSTRLPVAPTYAWVFGGKFIPRVQHSEVSTGVIVSSGSSGESSRVDLSLGGEFKFQRQNQIIWDLTMSFEKNHLSGEASLPDPETGATPKGVSVENTFTMFSLGYRWGQ